jgi:hypothetical protein
MKHSKFLTYNFDTIMQIAALVNCETACLSLETSIIIHSKLSPVL